MFFLYFCLFCLYFLIEYEDIEVCYSFIDFYKSICDIKVKKNFKNGMVYVYFE